MTSKQFATRRAELAPGILALYAQGLGHKPIAAQLGLAPRIVRKILIEQGVWKPGRLKRLHGGPYARNPLDPERIEREAKEWVAAEYQRIKRRIVKRELRAAAEALRPKRAIKFLSPKGLSDSEQFKWLYQNNPEFRLYQLLRRRMKKVIREGVKAGRSLELVGCTTEHLRAHIERQWARGMSWANTGTGKGKWHVDHTIPCNAFDLTKPEEQRLCFHWTNLRPMWSLKNISKGARFTPSTPCFAL